MATEISDHNLLFGVLALQADFLDAAQFAEACSAWAGRKGTPLPDLLVERGLLTAEQRGLVDLLLRQKLNKHGGDAHASLVGALATPDVRSVLESVADDDIRQSLAGLPSPDGPGLPMTVAYEPDARQRYTLTRMHARGGIGQVWLAHDEDIGRDVALKELRPDRGDSPAATARFLEEAKVTGQLEHPGIVPVYELVRPRAGKPCYTMRFVHGRTLADAIKDYHRRRQAGGVGPLDLRQLLTAFVGVCNAVAYAHSRGVLHRDLKPHNVALGDYGEVLVLDWGLAKQLGKAEDATSLLPVSVGQSEDREETRQGQVLGTPEYMAPEQAEGRLDLLDKRSDVYGLGAILYAVLTGEPPFGGGDTPEVLQRVVQEPPVPPRQRVASTPAALQAVCLKALAKERGSRYDSAGELAGEVEHFLADEPVAAYREPWRVRLGRWARHHRPLMAAAAALLLTATVALAVSTALIRNQELAALEAKGQAERERDRADLHLRLAKEAVEQTINRVAENRVLKQGDFHGLRKSLLASAVPFLERFVLQASDDPGLETERGRAYDNLALVRKEMGELGAARADYERALAIFARLAAENPAARDPRIRMGGGYHDLGNVLRAMGDVQGAEAAYRAALKEYQQLADQDPTAADFRHLLAMARNSLGTVSADQGDWKAAEREFRAALKEYQQLAGQGIIPADLSHLLAMARYNLGNALAGQGDRKAAEREYRAALKEQQRLVGANPDDPNYLESLVRTHNNLAVVLKDLGKWADTEDEYRSALKASGQLVGRYPSVPDYRHLKAWTHNNLGGLLAEIGKRPAAEAEYRAALKEQQRLVDEHPAVPDYRSRLGSSHDQLGRLLDALGKPVEAEAEFQAALEEQKRLTVKYPDVPVYRSDLASSRVGLGGLLRHVGRLQEAEAELRAALKERERLVADSPLPNYRQNLANAHDQLGMILFGRGKQDEAEAEHRAALNELRRLVDDHPNVPDYRSNLAGAHIAVGATLHVQNDRAAAEVEYRTSLKELRWLSEHFPSVPEYQRQRGVSHVNLGELLLPDAARRTEAEAELKQASDLLGKLVTDHPEVFLYRKQLGLVHYNYACLEAIQMRESAGKGAVQEQHAIKAMEWLHKAKEHGAFREPFYRQDIGKNTDLAPLRKRPDFQKLLAELKKPG
jgi:serine/threonine-protein kinase